jgi:hypothetical protein
MINLLPPIEKNKLASEMKEKILFIWSIIILSALVCLTLILLAIKFYLLADVDYQNNILKEARQEDQSQDISNFTDIVKKYNATLVQLDSFYKKEIYFNKVLGTINGISFPENLYLTSISLARATSGYIQVNISGISATRDELISFRKSIEEQKKIINPSFSSESWVSPKNVNFTLSFQINEN